MAHALLDSITTIANVLNRLIVGRVSSPYLYYRLSCKALRYYSTPEIFVSFPSNRILLFTSLCFSLFTTKHVFSNKFSSKFWERKNSQRQCATNYYLTLKSLPIWKSWYCKIKRTVTYASARARAHVPVPVKRSIDVSHEDIFSFLL